MGKINELQVAGLRVGLAGAGGQHGAGGMGGTKAAPPLLPQRRGVWLLTEGTATLGDGGLQGWAPAQN